MVTDTRVDVVSAGGLPHGRIRPVGAPANVHASAVIWGVPRQKSFPIKMATHDDQHKNNRWFLNARPAGQVVIQSKWTHAKIPELLMTVPGDPNVGVHVIAAAPGQGRASPSPP